MSTTVNNLVIASDSKTEEPTPPTIKLANKKDNLTKLLVAHAEEDSPHSHLLKSTSKNSGYPLRLYQLSWRTHLKDTHKNVTECCIYVDKLRLPTICQSSIANTKKILNLNQISVISDSISAEDDIKTHEIPLTNYIQSFCNRNRMPISKILRMRENTSKNNSIFIENEPILYNVQLSFIPDSKKDFNFVSYNCHSQIKKPASLIIISSVNGTSAVVAEGNFQKLFFNNNGKRSNFICNSSKEYLTIIQIPLICELSSNDWSSWMPWPSYYFAEESKPTSALMNEITNQKVMQVIPRLYPMCNCYQPLTQSTPNLSYGEIENSMVTCDMCSNTYSGDDIIWHCNSELKKAVDIHSNGYDLCNICAQKQLEFIELRGIDVHGIQRDFRQPIRVTFQYFMKMETEIITPLIVDEIIDIFKAHARVFGNCENEEKKEIFDEMDENIFKLPKFFKNVEIGGRKMYKNMEIITAALQGLNIKNWQKILQSFERENITDSDLIRIDWNGNRDLEILIQTLGPRMRFREWLKNYQIKYREIGDIENVMSDESTSVVRNAMFALNVEKKLVQKYLKNFVHHCINDDMLPYLLSIMDDASFEELVPELGPRMLFRAWLDGSLLCEQYPNPFLIKKQRKA